MNSLATAFVLAPGTLFAYAYGGYPALLWLASRGRRASALHDWEEWPFVTLTVPVYNEERNIRAKLDDLLALDYPADRLHILVISDASTDATEDIVRTYADRGVELLRLPSRRGKTAAENAAGTRLRGSVVVNSDATVRLPRNALRALARAFQDPSVGVASGRDVSVGDERRDGAEENRAESGYVGYEMWVRGLETRLGSIVGASGCFYGIRACIYDAGFPEHLSRDFASALMARASGYRAVSVDDAVCFVPRAASLQAEFRRKIRTMSRGLDTLWYWRRMMNPRRYGTFAFMVVSHKLARWLVYLSLPFALGGLVALSARSVVSAAALGAAAVGAGLGVVALKRGPEVLRAGRFGALLGFAFASMFAGVVAWVTVLRRRQNAVWEPTRRPA